MTLDFPSLNDASEITQHTPYHRYVPYTNHSEMSTSYNISGRTAKRTPHALY
jgi:hypothetical protein